MDAEKSKELDAAGSPEREPGLSRSMPGEWERYLQAVPQPIIVLDPAHGVVAANRAAMTILGKTEGEILGSRCHDLFHASCAPAEGCPMEKLASEGFTGPVEREMEMETLHGTFLVSCTPIFDEEGRLSRIVHLASDITNLKKTQRALQESEERYRLHFENIYDVVFSIDGNAKILGISPSVERLLGYAPGEIKGRVLGELHILTPSSLERALEDVKRVVRGEKITGTEYTCRAKDGAEKIIEMSVSPVRSGEGVITGIVCAARDITERVAAEQATLESEQSLRAILAASPTGIVRVRDRSIQWANETMCRISGYSSEELTGQSTRMFYESDEQFKRIETALYHGEGQVETTLVTKHGTVLDVLIQISPMDSYSYIATVADITRQKEAEYELKLTRFTVDRAVDSILWLGEKGEILYANDAACAATGYSRDELLSMTILEVDADFSPLMWTEVWSLRKERASMAFETHLRRKDGQTYPAEVRAYYLEYMGREYFCANLRDITERKRSEEALHESEAKYRTVVESSLVGYYVIQDGKFRFVNRRFCDIFGYSHDEIVDTLSPDDLTHPDDREKVVENLRRRITGEADRIEYSFRAVRKDGAEIMVKVIGTVLNYNGRPAATGNLIDITREETLETQLRQAQKMEAVGTLAGGIAHDFNNILTVISGYGSLLKMATENTSPLRMYVDPILSSSEKAATLTRSLLAFSRQQPILLTPLNINKSVKSTEKLLKRLLTEDVELVTALSPREMIIMGDATQMEQILFNLATNARDAMQKGGRLTIETRLAELDEEYVNAHGYGAPGTFALLLVSDTGTGMDAATRDKIFDPFFTTKEMGKGTGLGLSTVYGIVKQHNGYIDVYSDPGAGTAFHIYFPAVRASAREDRPSPPPVKRGTETILVAEDDGDVRRLVKSILTKHGYTVVEALDGEDAIVKFGAHPEIDLVVLDSVMPRKNGREVYDAVRAANPGVRVIFTSGYTRDIVLDKGIETKEVDFISKPILPEDMLAKVREVLDR